MEVEEIESFMTKQEDNDISYLLGLLNQQQI